MSSIPVSIELNEKHKLELLINNQFTQYTNYINNMFDRKAKYNFLFHHTMIEFFKEIQQLNINDNYTRYSIYVLDKLEEIPSHRQYLRYLKMKKINELNDTKN